MNNIVAVFIGGGIGSVVRYLLSIWIKKSDSFSFPVATLIANLVSCLVLAIVVFGVLSKNDQPFIRMLLVVGFCGGLSTFSTFSYETLELMRAGNTVTAVINILLSVTACLLVLYVIAKR